MDEGKKTEEVERFEQPQEANNANAEGNRQRRDQNDVNYEQLLRYGLIIESEKEARSWGESLEKETESRTRSLKEYLHVAIELAKSADRFRKRLLRIGGNADPKGSSLEAARWQTLRTLDQIDTFFRGSNQLVFDPPSHSREDKQKLNLNFLVTYTQIYDSMKPDEVVLDFDVPPIRRGHWLREQAKHVIEVKKIPSFTLFLLLAKEPGGGKSPIINTWFDRLYASIRFAYLTEESLIILNDIWRACRPHYPFPQYNENPRAHPWAEVVRALYMMHCELRESRKKILSPKTRDDE